MADLSSVLPTMSPTAYFGIPVRSGPQPSVPSLPALPTSMVSQARTAAAQAQQTPTLPPVAPPATSEWSAPAPAPKPMGPEAAAPNVIQGGAFPLSEVAGMVHPAEHAIAYQQNLARQRDIQPFNGTNTNEFTTLDASSPRMEGPAPAAPNVIRAGISSGDAGGGGGGISPMQLQAIAPLLEARLHAQADPTMMSKKFVMDETQKEYDLQIALQRAQASNDKTGMETAQRGLAWMQSPAHQSLMLQHKINAGLILPTMESAGIRQ